MAADTSLHGRGLAVDHDESGTRDRVRGLVVTEGPIDAARLAQRLELTPAGIRRHLSALVEAGEIAERPAPTGVRRGRGRPAREYIATTAGQTHLPDQSAQVAIAALHRLAEVVGTDGVHEFADARLAAFEETYAPVVDAAGPDVAARTRALAAAFDADGYAASTRVPSAGLPMIQLCQGHCPLQPVAVEFPELCEAETRLIARLLGVHVQRLATIAGGGHACTTAIPTAALPGDSPTMSTTAEETHA